jgi:hypothetical protein
MFCQAASYNKVIFICSLGFATKRIPLKTLFFSLGEFICYYQKKKGYN